MQTIQNNPKCYVYLWNCHGLTHFLLYCCPGRLELKEDTIESLLSASCLLQLSSVVQACCSFLVKQLHPSNCLGIRSYADAQGCHDLQRAAHAYTMVGKRGHFTCSVDTHCLCGHFKKVKESSASENVDQLPQALLRGLQTLRV